MWYLRVSFCDLNIFNGFLTAHINSLSFINIKYTWLTYNIYKIFTLNNFGYIYIYIYIFLKLAYILLSFIYKTSLRVYHIYRALWVQSLRFLASAQDPFAPNLRIGQGFVVLKTTWWKFVKLQVSNLAAFSGLDLRVNIKFT